MKQKTIKITKEFKVPGTNIILEKGDKVKILKEDVYEALDEISGKLSKTFKPDVANLLKKISKFMEKEMESITSDHVISEDEFWQILNGYMQEQDAVSLLSGDALALLMVLIDNF